MVDQNQAEEVVFLTEAVKCLCDIQRVCGDGGHPHRSKLWIRGKILEKALTESYSEAELADPNSRLHLDEVPLYHELKRGLDPDQPYPSFTPYPK